MSIASTDLQKAFSMANVDALFKINFKKYYDQTFNKLTPLWNMIPKTNDFTGKKLEFPVPTGYQGGVGSGSLPEANVAPYGDCVITSKRVYAVSRVEREAIMASLSDIGAFKRILAEAAQKTVEADMWNQNRILFADGSGSLGTLAASAAVVDNTGGSYTLTVSTTTWKEANWEEKMFVNFDSGTDLFEITAVDPTNKAFTVQRQGGGTNIPVNASIVYMQGSKNNDPYGLKLLDTSGGTLFGITVNRRWKAYQQLSWGAGVTPEVMNKMMLGVEKQCGKAPNTITTSYLQYEKILNQLEDKKRYTLTSQAAKGVKGQLSFDGVQFMSSRGAINIFPDKFCEDDRMYFLNTDYLTYYRRPNSGWVKDDIGGNGYLRVAGEDEFEARYATYGQFFIALPFHGVLAGLT